MDTTEIGKRIKAARTLRDVTLGDVAENIGVAKSTIQRYETGQIESPKIPVLHAIANSLKVNPAWLVNKSDDMHILRSKTYKTVKIPVLGRVAAGVPIEAQEDIIDEVDIPADWDRDEYFGLQIQGDSMEPRIEDGDIVIVHDQPDAESGELVVVMVDESATCKRLMKYVDGIMLISTNPKYEPMHFSNREVEKRSIRVLGKVIESRRKY